MAEYLTNTAEMKIVADAIRAKGGTAAPLTFPQGMADAVSAISGGGGIEMIHGVVTLPDASNTITIPRPDPSKNYSIAVEIRSPKADLDGANGVYLFKNFMDVSVAGQQPENTIHVVLEMRQGWPVSKVQCNMSTMWHEGMITDESFTIPARQGSFPFFAGEYDYYLIPLEVPV